MLHRPLLYLSHYLKRHRAEYYDRLMRRQARRRLGGLARFFLRGVAETAEEATPTPGHRRPARAHRALVQDEGLGLNGLRLLDLIFRRPSST